MSSNRNRSNDKNNHHDDDLDLFLTTMESKLRSPFSSLDWAKTLSTLALRQKPGGNGVTWVLSRLRQVLDRLDQVIQVRLLIGLLLGWKDETSKKNGTSLNGEIWNLLQQAQGLEPIEDGDDDNNHKKEGTPKDEWVRMVAGLIQGTLFCERDSDESCVGQETHTLMQQTCDEIISAVLHRSAEQQTTKADATDGSNKKEQGEDSKASTTTTTLPDLNASYAPFYYGLVNYHHESSSALLPECGSMASNPHFQVNESADILQMDDRLMLQRAKDDRTMLATATTDSTSSRQKHQPPGNGSTTTSSKAPTSLPPGFRSKTTSNTTTAKKRKAAPTQSSMFMPTKRKLAPTSNINRKALQPPKKTLLRQRKGAAQSLLDRSLKSKLQAQQKGNAPKTTAPTLSATKAALMARRRGPSSSSSKHVRSKMKMLDVAEVDALKKRKQEEQEQNSKKSKRQRKGDIENNTTAMADAAPVATGESAKKGEQESSSSSNKQPQNPPPPQASNNTPPKEGSALPVAVTAQTEEWQTMLQERSNKLSHDDRQRVQTFFQHLQSKTQAVPPDGVAMVSKMKLHEQRSTDINTNQPIKETFYLELDYQQGTWKQSKKVKRY